MVDRPIELPKHLGDDAWSRVHQARMGDRVRPVRDHNKNQREDQEADRRDSFERQFPGHEREGKHPGGSPQPLWRFILDLPLSKEEETPPEPVPEQPGKGANLDLQA